MKSLVLVLLMLCVASDVHVSAQAVDGARKGMTWVPPASFVRLRGDLRAMSEHGVEAVRVELVFDANVHVVAEMFGVTLFQELALRFLPAERMMAEQDAAIAAIDSALYIAGQIPGSIVVGLGYWNDTSDSRTCDVMAALSERVKRSAPSAQTYYVTAFIENDRCEHVVDFVMLDLRDDADPRGAVAAWRANHTTPIGIAAIGTRVKDDVSSGHLVQASAEYQARHLENNFNALADDSALAALFVDTWITRDDPNTPEIALLGEYGILDARGMTRPAADVVRGFYTHGQTVFAFQAGEPATHDFSWINFIVLLAAIMFGLTYYRSPNLQSLLRRYFFSHSFYLQKVGDGREPTMSLSLFILGFLSVAASVVGATLTWQVNSTNLWIVLLAWLPDWLSGGLRTGIVYPPILLVVFSGLFALVTLLWAGTLSTITRGTAGLTIGQTLMLAVFPRWPVAIIGVFALVVLNWNLNAPGFVVLAVTATWLTVVLVYTGRLFSDYLRLLGITAVWTIPVLFLALGISAGTLWLTVVTQDLTPELMYLWHLASLT